MNPKESLAHTTTPRLGVLLVNLGTPDSPTPQAVRRYLAEFLSDPRVVEIPRAIWLPILYGFVLPFRPKRVAHAYASVWQDGGSPLLVGSQQLTDALADRLGAEFGTSVVTALAMRYGKPSIAAAMDRFERENVRRILVLPLYPQYSASTTAAVMDVVFASLMQRRWIPELRSIHQYHDDPGYIAALANSVREHWNAKGPAERLMLSFHGIPKHYVSRGDPYYCHCQKTARLLIDDLGCAPDRVVITFQSRFGRTPWLEPYTDVTLKALGAQGVSSVDVLCPGFAVDCLETLEEIAIRNRDDFLAAGGRELRYIPALNDTPEHADALQALVRSNLAGWLPNSDPPPIATRHEQIVELKRVF